MTAAKSVATMNARKQRDNNLLKEVTHMHTAQSRQVQLEKILNKYEIIIFSMADQITWQIKTLVI